MVKPKFDLRDTTERDRMYQKYSDEQLAFYHAIQDKLFIGCNACAGSGKTLVSLHCAIELLSQSKVSRVIYVRVPSDRDKKLGYLPGTLEEKCSILWAPAYDALMTLGVQKEAIEQLEEEQQIFFTSDIGLRGCNLEKSVAIIDEAQNADVESLRLILTRFKDDSHVVLIGDSLQNDNRSHRNDFETYCNYMCEPAWGTKVTLTKNYRGKLSKHAENYGRDS